MCLVITQFCIFSVVRNVCSKFQVVVTPYLFRIKTHAYMNSCSQSAKKLYPAVMSTAHESLCMLRQA